LTGRGGLTLIECLVAARAPWDAARARDEAARRAREQRLAQLGSDPDLLRGHLREHVGANLTQWLERFGHPARVAFYLSVEGREPLSEIEREALLAFARYVGENILSFWGDTKAVPTVEQQAQVDRLVELHLSRQETLLGELLEQLGPLPSLRAAHETISGGEPLDKHPLAALPEGALMESERRQAQEERRERYLGYRQRATRREAGLLGRLTHQTEVLARQMDERVLRYCGECGETSYPETVDGVNEPTPAERCAYCRLQKLLTLNDAAKTYPDRFQG
jgi:hypothetical protein